MKSDTMLYIYQSKTHLLWVKQINRIQDGSTADPFSETVTKNWVGKRENNLVITKLQNIMQF